jgi:penicillin-binding protein 2
MPLHGEHSGATTQSDFRLRVLLVISAAGFSLLFLRLFQLQIFRGAEMHRLAELNRTQVIPLTAPRGYVMDRSGDVMLDNTPLFSVFFSNLLVSKSDQLKVSGEIERLFPESAEMLRPRMGEACRTGKMTRILSNVDRDRALALIERRLTLPGVNVVVEPQRRARYGTIGAHILGYAHEISPAELERLRDEGYRQGQLIGKAGVERTYNSVIKGEDGGLQFETDATGRHLQVLRRIPSRSGMDLVLTVDHRIQEALEKGLAASPTGRGAGVVLDPRTGEVLALASAPSYDPTGDVARAVADPALPLYNRALQGTYPPGSIFKPVTAVAALGEGQWDIRRTFNCTGMFRLGRKEFACWERHNRQDFMGAVAWSCNFYFYNMGLHIGPDPIERAARALGLGVPTGIDLPSESAGFIPGREWKKRANQMWFDGDTVNYSIGQGAVLVTPLQAAVMFSALVNGGIVRTPYVVSRVQDSEGRVVQPHSPSPGRAASFAPGVLDTMKEALRHTATEGTARAVYRPDLVVGGKTGTAQNPQGKDHAWFAAFAGRTGEPASLVVVVFVEHGGRGSVAGGPIARAVITAAFPIIPAKESQGKPQKADES